MTELVLATRSGHKLQEIRAILAPYPDLRVVDLDAAGVAYDPAEEGLEPFETFQENALSKARYFYEMTGRATVADDSGLEVDALDGRPGVRSKRFSPAQHLEGDALDRANLDYLLQRLGDTRLPRRTARYVCVAALVAPDGSRTFRGEAPGLILDRPQGWGGFGYDPVFFDPALGKTFAQISQAEKNERSHRGLAFRALAEAIGQG